MKKIALVAFSLIIGINMIAQDPMTEEVDYIQSIYGMEKKNIVSQFLNLSSEQSEAFWPVYDAYEVQRKELGKKRITLLTEFETLNSEITEEKADAWMKEVIKLGKANDKLVSTYYKKVKKVVGSIKAAQFYQIETYLLTAQRFGIQDNLPVVGGQLD